MIYPYRDDLPLLPISLYHAGHEVIVNALVDSGSMGCVLPYSVGVSLGFVWEEQTFPVELSGAYRGIPAYGVLIRGEVESFPPMALVFAWCKSENIRAILGHINFFEFFEVRFRTFERAFELVPKSTQHEM